MGVTLRTPLRVTSGKMQTSPLPKRCWVSTIRRRIRIRFPRHLTCRLRAMFRILMLAHRHVRLAMEIMLRFWLSLMWFVGFLYSNSVSWMISVLYYDQNILDSFFKNIIWQNSFEVCADSSNNRVNLTPAVIIFVLLLLQDAIRNLSSYDRSAALENWIMRRPIYPFMQSHVPIEDTANRYWRSGRVVRN